MKRYLIFILLTFSTCMLAIGQTSMSLQLNPVIDTLAKKIKQNAPKKRVAIAYITDSNNNRTELSEHIANYLGVRLVNDDLPLVDRTLAIMNTEEKIRAVNGEIDIERTLANVKNAGIEVYIKGEYAYSGNSLVLLTLKAISVENNTIIAAAMGELTLNDQTNDQAKGVIGGTSAGRGGIANISPTRIGDAKINPLDDLFRAKISDMRPEDCNCVPMYKEVCGGICFENQTGQDLVMYSGYFLEATIGGRDWYNRLLPVPQGGRNCIDKIDINSSFADQQSISIIFKFKTTDPDRPRFGEIKLTIDRCKVKAYVLTKANLPLYRQ